MSRAAQVLLGSVVSVWRYPVKSMKGEELNVADITEAGLLGDRAYALLDTSTGKVASAKNPRKWAKLLEFQATFAQPARSRKKIPPVRITLPDGTIVGSEQSDINQVLSGVLGRDVRLITMPPKAAKFEEYWPDIDGLAHRETVTDEPMGVGAPAGTFFDLAAVHLLTTATLDRLRDLQPEGHFEVRRFRPNVCLRRRATRSSRNPRSSSSPAETCFVMFPATGSRLLPRKYSERGHSLSPSRSTLRLLLAAS